MINFLKEITTNVNAGLAGITVSLTGRLIQVTNILTDLDGVLGLVVKLFLAVVYIATAVWLMIQSINMYDQLIERRRLRKKNKRL